MAACEVIAVRVSTLLCLRKRYVKKNTNIEKMPGMKYNADIDEVKAVYWEEAKLMCEAIRAGRHIAGKQTIGTIISE